MTITISASRQLMNNMKINALPMLKTAHVTSSKPQVTS